MSLAKQPNIKFYNVDISWCLIISTIFWNRANTNFRVVLRKWQGSGTVHMGAAALHFKLGQDLLDWVVEMKITLK